MCKRRWEQPLHGSTDSLYLSIKKFNKIHVRKDSVPSWNERICLSWKHNKSLWRTMSETEILLVNNAFANLRNTAHSTVSFHSRHQNCRKTHHRIYLEQDFYYIGAKTKVKSSSSLKCCHVIAKTFLKCRLVCRQCCFSSFNRIHENTRNKWCHFIASSWIFDPHDPRTI